MSAFAYREPYRLSAGVLTLITHVVFFVMLYLGVNWHAQQPQGMQVDLWASLPETAAAPPVSVPPAPPPKEETAPKKAETPAPPAKAEIELAQKKKQVATKPEPKRTLSPAEKKRAQEEIQALNKQEEQAEQRAQAAREESAAQAAKARAAITSEVEKYKGLIRSKIRNNMVMPPEVEDDVTAEFVITLLPDGSLLNVTRVKASGNAAYDSAVERAIWKAKTLPLPKEEEARKQFINPNQLRLKFSPKDGE